MSMLGPGNGWWVAARTDEDARLLLEDRQRARARLGWRFFAGVAGIVVVVALVVGLT